MKKIEKVSIIRENIIPNVILSFLNLISKFINLFAMFFKITHNGPRLGDSGGLESQNFQSFTNLSNSFLLFTKLTKKEI